MMERPGRWLQTGALLGRLRRLGDSRCRGADSLCVPGRARGRQTGWWIGQRAGLDLTASQAVLCCDLYQWVYCLDPLSCLGMSWGRGFLVRCLIC